MKTAELPEFQAVPEDYLHAGDTVADRYVIRRSLGHGGFAQVYLGSHQEVDSLQVAIKILHPHRATPETLVRFRNEAQLLARLRNRHTVRLTDFGVTEQRMAYLVMEYVQGTPLDIVIRRRGNLGEADTARVAMGVLKSLVEAHSVGVIHRDLKPANIILASEVGERHALPRVLDFGIAKVLGGGSPVEDHIVHPDGSFEPIVYCTPAYAAPELLRGRPDFPTDLYALGLVMLEMLHGQPPYEYPDDDPAASPHLWEAPVPLGERAGASRLAPILRRALEKEIEDRYQSAEEMLVDVEAVIDGLRAAELDGSTLDVETVPDPPSPQRDPSRASQFVATSVVGGRIDEVRRDAVRKGSTGVVWKAPPPRESPIGKRSAAMQTEETSSDPLAVPADRSPSLAPTDTLPPREPGALSPAAKPPIPEDDPFDFVDSTAPPVPAEPWGPSGGRPHVRNEISVSRAAEVPLFGGSVLSGRATRFGTLIVILAIILPALVAALSVLHYMRSQERPPVVVPTEEGDVE